MMSTFYNDFFRNHERLFRDFENDFGRDSVFSQLPGARSTFHQELPMLSWTDDDFFLPIQQQQQQQQQRQGANVQIDSGLRDLNSKFEQDYKKLRQNYEQQLHQIQEKRIQQQQGLQQSPAEGPAQQQQQQQPQQQLSQQQQLQQQQQQQQKQQQQKQQQQHQAATGVAGKMDVEQERKQQQQVQQPRRSNDVYEYQFISSRQYKDGQETGETVEKKEKLIDGKKILETKITKYNPDGTKDVQRITEDENGKKETKLRLDNKDQPLQLQ